MKYSVIIPIYNGEDFLKECIDSVVNQGRKDVELILVNDGSTDNSLEICREYSEKDDSMLAGYTDTMKLVNVKAPKEMLGEIVNVKITDVKTWSMDGEVA